MLDLHFPSTMVEFEATFGTEEKCREYLFRQKWPEGFRCPRCGSCRYWSLTNREIMVCATCEHHASLTAGTHFHKTRKSLKEWFWTLYMMTTSKRGLSAKELQRHLGCSYKTAWTWLQKLRRAMVNPDREPLSGEVEIDESYIGGPEEGVKGRETEDKAIIVCAAEKDGAGTGRIRLGVVENASRKSLKAFIQGKVAPGSVAHTDGWVGYKHLERSGYYHLVTVMRGSDKKAHEVFPRVHRIFSLVKRWVLGTHQGSVSRKHLGTYLEEFTFRFNRRTAKNRTLLFQRLIEGVVREPCLPYWQIIGRTAPHSPLEMA